MKDNMPLGYAVTHEVVYLGSFQMGDSNRQPHNGRGGLQLRVGGRFAVSRSLAT